MKATKESIALRKSLNENKKKNEYNRESNSAEDQDICAEEFYGDSGSFSRECNKSHEIDHNKVVKGPCLFEYLKTNSCPHKNRCRFIHKLPNVS